MQLFELVVYHPVKKQYQGQLKIKQETAQGITKIKHERAQAVLYSKIAPSFEISTLNKIVSQYFQRKQYLVRIALNRLPKRTGFRKQWQ